LYDNRLSYDAGGCPHAAIREDITANMLACEELTLKHGCNLILLESGGDNLSADFSRELADFTVSGSICVIDQYHLAFLIIRCMKQIYVIDTAGGDKVPRKGGPGITQSDLLVVSKLNLLTHYFYFMFHSCER